MMPGNLTDRTTMIMYQMGRLFSGKKPAKPGRRTLLRMASTVFKNQPVNNLEYFWKISPVCSFTPVSAFLSILLSGKILLMTGISCGSQNSLDILVQFITNYYLYPPFIFFFPHVSVFADYSHAFTFFRLKPSIT